MKIHWIVGVLLMGLLPSCTLTNITNGVSSNTPRACPNAGGMPPLALADDPSTFAPAIKTFLSDGGSVALLTTILSENGFMQPTHNQHDLPDGGGAWYQDITGDGYKDVLVNLAFEATDASNRPYQQSIIWLFACDNGFYQIASEILSDASSRHGVQVGAVADLNGDARAEIYYHQYKCIEAGCVVKLNVWMWNGNRLVTMLENDLEFMAGTYRLEEHDLFVFTAAYTPPDGTAPTERPMRQVWQWFGNHLVLKREQAEVVTTVAESILDVTQAWSVGAFNEAQNSLAYARTMDEGNPFLGYAAVVMALAQVESTDAPMLSLMTLPDTTASSYWKRYGQALAESANLTEGCLAILNALEAELQQGTVTLNELLGIGQDASLPPLNDLCPF
ncbi:MAG: FG-GAP repeat domain-containing protein [Phototrophicaceae bacterium]